MAEIVRLLLVLATLFGWQAVPATGDSFEDGTWTVPDDVKPGTYRGHSAGNQSETRPCYWERLSGFGGTFAEMITNDLVGQAGPVIVTIKKGDAGFSSEACGPWVRVKHG